MRVRREKCVDASLAIKVVVKEHNSDRADDLFERWRAERERLIAPPFFEVEADSILRKKVMVTKTLTPEQAAAAFQRLQALPIRSTTVPGQRERAWAIAGDLDLTTKDVPDEEWQRLRSDLAENLDHYLYGASKEE